MPRVSNIPCPSCGGKSWTRNSELRNGIKYRYMRCKVCLAQWVTEEIRRPSRPKQMNGIKKKDRATLHTYVHHEDRKAFDEIAASRQLSPTALFHNIVTGYLRLYQKEKTK